jgi:hypothetical protein
MRTINTDGITRESGTDHTISDVRVISIVWLGEKRVGRFAGLKVERLGGQ